jgi:hypothetical protein
MMVILPILDGFIKWGKSVGGRRRVGSGGSERRVSERVSEDSRGTKA